MTVAAEPSPGIIERIRQNEALKLALAPLGLSVLVVLTLVLIGSVDPDTIAGRALQTEKIRIQFVDHITLTLWSTLIVLLVAIPLGVFLTRPRFARWEGPVLAVANSGQAFPAYGLLVIFLTWFGSGAATAIWALAFYAILPVLRNTIVGIQQVDRDIIEAGRGMGMTKRQALLRIELPLAVPVMIAGVRTALIINVGMAALAFLIGAGGLGETINTGLKLQRDVLIVAGASMVAVLALGVDWVAAMLYRVLRPKGL
ncbi:MAG: ABC transporter permease [Acidimicrobiia bacterium]|nr:ABC transporter permease [Acidimicrobiia bacterium]